MDTSFTLSSPSQNPYADLQTPTKPKVENGGLHNTPTSLVRNIFARPRQSALDTPSKRTVSPNAVVLPKSKRSFTKWTPSPQDVINALKQEKEASPSPRMPEQPPLLEIRARDEKQEAAAPEIPNAQASPLLSLPGQHSLSPTMVNPSVMRPSPTAAARELRPKKRVRLSSPTQPSRSSASQHSVVTAASSTTGPSDRSSGQELAKDAWQFHQPPPSRRRVMDTMDKLGLETVEYPEPFYSNELDVPPRNQHFAGRVFKVKGNGVSQLGDFDSRLQHQTNSWLKTKRFEPARARFGWEYVLSPPTQKSVTDYCEQKSAEGKPQSIGADSQSRCVCRCKRSISADQSDPEE